MHTSAAGWKKETEKVDSSIIKYTQRDKVDERDLLVDFFTNKLTQQTRDAKTNCIYNYVIINYTNYPQQDRL